MNKEIILTCSVCYNANPRSLPYNMVKPDQCEHCDNPFRTWLDVLKIEYGLWRRQSKLASAAEAVVNTGVGVLIAFAAQWLICWAYNIPLSASDNAIIVGWMTGISVIRSYVIRRAWNSEFWKSRKPSEPCVENGDIYCCHVESEDCETEKALYGN